MYGDDVGHSHDWSPLDEREARGTMVQLVRGMA
jgi:hypothetical protein